MAFCLGRGQMARLRTKSSQAHRREQSIDSEEEVVHDQRHQRGSDCSMASRRVGYRRKRWQDGGLGRQGIR